MLFMIFTYIYDDWFDEHDESWIVVDLRLFFSFVPIWMTKEMAVMTVLNILLKGFSVMEAQLIELEENWVHAHDRS